MKTVIVFCGVNIPEEVWVEASKVAQVRNNGRQVTPFSTAYDVLTEWCVAGFTAHMKAEKGPNHKRQKRVKC